MIRLFVAVPLPDDVADELLAMQHGVPGARWRDDAQLHLTLRFIGEVDGARYRDVVSALARVRAAPFELTLQGAGFFPPRGPVKVLWAGVGPSGALDALQRSVDSAITRLGLPSDRRRWTPHVTLARLDGAPAPKVARFLSAHALYRSRPFAVDGFELHSSRLHPKGPVYELEQRFPLADTAGRIIDPGGEGVDPWDDEATWEPWDEDEDGASGAA